MNGQRLVNTVLHRLPLRRLQLLENALSCAKEDAEQWCREINGLSSRVSAAQGNGDLVWQVGNRLLNLLRVIDDIIITVDYETTTSFDDCECPGYESASEHRTAIRLDPQGVSIFIESLSRLGHDVRDELVRAFNDLEASLQRVFCYLVPCLYLEPGGGNAQFDSYVVFELLREVMHIMYHLEHDILNLGD